MAFRHCLCAAAFAVAAAPAWAQTVPRVLLVGDSWAAQQWEDGTHALVFDAHGFGHHGVVGAATTVSGSTAAEWVAPARLELISQTLADNPGIDTVQLTIGGNDFLDAWSVTMSPGDVANLQAQIRDDLSTVVNHVLAVRPDIEVVISLYDYPNFRDTLGGLVGLFVCRPLHNSLGQPSPLQINQAMTAFESYLSELTTHPRVYHVGHAGQMQYAFGSESDDIPPGELLPPGDLTLPTPVEVMRSHGVLGDDCFHLAPQGYDVLVENLYQNYFHVRFDTVFKSSLE